MPADGPAFAPWAVGALQESFITAARQQLVASRAMGHYVGRPKLPLITRPGESSDNCLVSPAKAIADKAATALFGKEIVCQIDNNPGAESYLYEVWRRNKRGQTLLKWGLNGAITGTAYLRLLDPDATGMFPRIVVLDPLNVDIQHNPDDFDEVWKITITPPALDTYGAEPGKDSQRHRTVISNASGDAGYSIPQGNDRWTITDQTMANGEWQTTVQTVWPYPWCPVIYCQNIPQPNSFYGTADLDENLCHMFDSLNRVASMWNKTIRLFASPKVYASGLGPRTVDMSPDQILYLPSDQAKLAVLEMQSDAASLQAFYDRLLEMISMQSRTPLVALGLPDQQGPLSGVSLTLRWQPLVDKTEAKHQTYGDALGELDRRILSMAGLGDDIVPEYVWPDILPVDPLAERQIMVLDDSLGIVSKATLAKKAGYDPSYEAEEMAKEKAEAVQTAQEAMGGPLEAAPGQGAPQDGNSPNGAVPPPQALAGPQPATAKGRGYS